MGNTKTWDFGRSSTFTKLGTQFVAGIYGCSSIQNMLSIGFDPSPYIMGIFIAWEIIYFHEHGNIMGQDMGRFHGNVMGYIMGI